MNFRDSFKENLTVLIFIIGDALDVKLLCRLM